MSDWKEPRFVIAYTIITGFFVAYVFNPSETMNGALIAAFAGAWGYFLGSSSSSHQVREQVGKALDVAAAATTNAETPKTAKDAAEQVATAAKEEAETIKGATPVEEDERPDYAR